MDPKNKAGDQVSKRASGDPGPLEILKPRAFEDPWASRGTHESLAPMGSWRPEPLGTNRPTFHVPVCQLLELAFL